MATANILGPRLRTGSLRDDDLRLVQKRRELPTRVTQAFQPGILRDLYPKSLDDDTTGHVPPILAVFRPVPPLRHLVGRFVGLGVRPEHVA